MRLTKTVYWSLPDTICLKEGIAVKMAAEIAHMDSKKRIRSSCKSNSDC